MELELELELESELELELSGDIIDVDIGGTDDIDDRGDKSISEDSSRSICRSKAGDEELGDDRWNVRRTQERFVSGFQRMIACGVLIEVPMKIVGKDFGCRLCWWRRGTCAMIGVANSKRGFFRKLNFL